MFHITITKRDNVGTVLATTTLAAPSADYALDLVVESFPVGLDLEAVTVDSLGLIAYFDETRVVVTQK